MNNSDSNQSPAPAASTTAPPQSAQTAPTAAEQASPSASLPPRPLTRRERPRPQFVASDRLRAPEADSRPPGEPPPPDDTIRVEYSLRISGGKEVIADIKSKFDLPLALREECLAKTDSDFPGIFDMVVVAPLTTRVRACLQKRYEDFAETKAKAAQEALPQGAGKPPNGSRYAMPAIDPTPPFTTMPGKVPQPGGRNGR